jgi:hypothetical protein
MITGGDDLEPGHDGRQVLALIRPRRSARVAGQVVTAAR